MAVDPARAKSVFLAASDLDPADRAAYLDRECGGDADLRERVEALLRADAGAPPEPATGAHESGRPGPTGAFVPADPQPGAVLAGKYRLAERIGEGGMGSVWLAHQSEPVQRKVAVKLIKPGMDSKSVLARFEAERQALAVMDHPNIAKVLDGGLTPDSRPFFVMELVKGVPITQFCDDRKLTPRERLALFVPVCQAIQHAHQKGVIHRDIKPSNVLVALYDDRPVPKVIDFGIAKATGGTLTEKTIETAFGGVVGTPEYMSPEQASLNNLDIDTRSDVYALGVLLYELLTGSPPFPKKELERKGLLEMLRVVREEEPPRPSTRLSTADALPTLAANRGTEPKKLTGLLRNELDWIVMKALAKDRAHRYETANGFAADVHRYLSGEPVVAHPPSTAYRVKKFVRRNRGPVTAAGLLVSALLLGVAGTAWGMVRADGQRQRAEDREADAKREKDLADAARKEAEQANGLMFRALMEETDAGIEALIGRNPTLGPAERQYLEGTLVRWRRFADAQGDSVRARDYRATGAGRVGILHTRLGRYEDALVGMREALRGYAALAADYPGEPKYRHEQAKSHLNLGTVYGMMQRGTEAVAEFTAARDLVAPLAAADADCRNTLSIAHGNLGLAHSRLGQFPEARAALGEAAAIKERLALDAPNVPMHRWELAEIRSHIGFLAALQQQLPESVAAFRETVRIRKELVGDHLDAPEYRAGLATSLHNLATMLSKQKQYPEAERCHREAIAVRTELAAHYPSVPRYRHDLSLSHTNLATLLRPFLKPDEVDKHFQTALALTERLVADFPKDLQYQISLGLLYGNYGNFVRDQNRFAESLTWYDRSAAILAPILERDPRQVEVREWMWHTHWGKAEALHRMRRSADAIPEWDAALKLAPPNKLPGMRSRRAMTLAHAGRAAEAAAEVEKLMALDKWPAEDVYFERVYDMACILAIAARDVPGKRDEQGRRAVELLELAIKNGFTDVRHLAVDKDLDAIRDRADFRKLASDLAAKFPPKQGKTSPPEQKK